MMVNLVANIIQVSAIVEVDPNVLGDERVQRAVEGRFLDSAISVREAAMELVGRHIVNRPDFSEKVELVFLVFRSSDSLVECLLLDPRFITQYNMRLILSFSLGGIIFYRLALELCCKCDLLALLLSICCFLV